MKTNNTDKTTKAEIIIPIVAVIVVVSLWLVSYYYITNHYGNGETIDWAIRGQVGDLFGAVNALFSGLAFAGIIYTIYLQRLELRAQRHELEQTRNEFVQQNDTLKRQRFEHTFFKLLESHNQVVERFKIKYEFNRPGLPHDGDILKSEGQQGFSSIIDILTEEQMMHIELYGDQDALTKMKESYRKKLTFLNKQQIDLYIQSLSTLLYFTARTELLKNTQSPENELNDRHFYFSIVTSAQTLKEKEFIYYHIALGWEILKINDPLRNLQMVETKHSIYRDCNNTYIKNLSSHSLLINKALNI